MIEVLRNSTSEARARSRDGQYLAVNIRYWHQADITNELGDVGF